MIKSTMNENGNTKKNIPNDFRIFVFSLSSLFITLKINRCRGKKITIKNFVRKIMAKCPNL